MSEVQARGRAITRDVTVQGRYVQGRSRSSASHHYGCPTKEKDHYRSRLSSVHRPSREAASRSQSTTAVPSADCAPYLTTCENSVTRLRRSTVPRTQPASGQWCSTWQPTNYAPEHTSAASASGTVVRNHRGRGRGGDRGRDSCMHIAAASSPAPWGSCIIFGDLLRTMREVFYLEPRRNLLRNYGRATEPGT